MLSGIPQPGETRLPESSLKVFLSLWFRSFGNEALACRTCDNGNHVRLHKNEYRTLARGLREHWDNSLLKMREYILRLSEEEEVMCKANQAYLHQPLQGHIVCTCFAREKHCCQGTILCSKVFDRPQSLHIFNSNLLSLKSSYKCVGVKWQIIHIGLQENWRSSCRPVISESGLNQPFVTVVHF